MQQLRQELASRDIDAETERMMRNWARWKCGVPIGLAISGAYDLEAPGRREEVSIPLLNGEAMDVDRAVEALPGDLRIVIQRHWLHAKGTIYQRAKACRCSIATYYRRLHHGHERIREAMRLRREQGRRIARALSGAALVKPPFDKSPAA